MTNLANPSAQFAFDFAARCPGLELRAECENDQAFLIALFVACSPLVGSLPKEMVTSQARFQYQAYFADYPAAARWIIVREAKPIGRIMIDWNMDGMSHCIDLAIMPDAQSSGIGTALLTGWIELSDLLGRDCFLQVQANSRAKALHESLGFIDTGDLYQPSLAMIRRVGV
jgi:ribosomal protein S18 acetylase RimI-like enzyme